MEDVDEAEEGRGSCLGKGQRQNQGIRHGMTNGQLDIPLIIIGSRGACMVNDHNNAGGPPRTIRQDHLEEAEQQNHARYMVGENRRPLREEEDGRTTKIA